jgi:hypothetical protein
MKEKWKTDLIHRKVEVDDKKKMKKEKEVAEKGEKESRYRLVASRRCHFHATAENGDEEERKERRKSDPNKRKKKRRSAVSSERKAKQ